MRAAVRERDGYACTECGLANAANIEATGRQLDVHRLVPGSRYTVGGCVTLCRGCHKGKPERDRGTPDLAGRAYSYRFTAVTLAQIEEMAVQDAAPTGATPNNTTTLARLIAEEYQRRAKAGKAKK